MNLSDNDEEGDDDDMSETTEDLHNKKQARHFQRQNNDNSPRNSVASTDTIQATGANGAKQKR